MKSRIAMAVLAASLLATAGLASAQQTYYRTAQVPGQATADTWTDPGAPQQSAMQQDQSTDMSYGQRRLQALHAWAAVQHLLRQLSAQRSQFNCVSISA